MESILMTISPDAGLLTGVLPKILDEVVSFVKHVENNDSKKEKKKEIISS